jgi:transcriptional regulator with PAS, ATPase and Fis domain
LSTTDTTLTLLRRDALEVPSLWVAASAQDGEVGARLGIRPVVVGSASDCDLVLADPGVSRRHCELRLGERGIEIFDLDSKNGTFVRDVAIVHARLEPGVPVTVGGTRLAVRVDGSPTVVPLSLGASFGEALGGSLSMRALFGQLERTAATDATILVTGESGTGKELIARAIHAASPRRDGPFEVLDCAAISPSLMEAELFGWERGAFTGAMATTPGVLARAHGGTLFIDELGELPLELQPKLLRALEMRQVRPLGSNAWINFDVRVVCATQRDLREQVAAGAFREDLFYRVAVVVSHVPPLRERKEDITLLVERFLSRQEPPRTLEDLPPGAMSLLVAHDWPGNVRELYNTVARLVLFPDLLRELGAGPGAPMQPASALQKLQLREARAIVVEQFERQYLAGKLREHAGNVSRAAESMGVSRQFLHRLLDRYGIQREP